MSVIKSVITVDKIKKQHDSLMNSNLNCDRSIKLNNNTVKDVTMFENGLDPLTFRSFVKRARIRDGKRHSLQNKRRY